MTETPRITTPFSLASTAAEVLDDVDLTGRRAIVTGGASGIGIETARGEAEPNRPGTPHGVAPYALDPRRRNACGRCPPRCSPPDRRG
jgi:hypothetical protein